MTPVNNLKRPLRLLGFDKTRLVAFHLKSNKKATVTGFNQIEKIESAHELDSLCAIMKMMVTKRLLQTDNAKL